MRMSIWQFTALLAALLLGYLIYVIWWSDQDQAGWIHKLQRLFFANEEEMKSSSAPAAEPAENDNSWIK